MQDMNVLDIFAGAGGLSFLCGREHNASLKAKWAVDFNASACASYQVNHPDAVVGRRRFKQAWLHFVIYHCCVGANV